MFSFAGKTAVVTGGGSGIGQAVVKRLAEHGASVVVLDISEAAARESVDLVTAAGGREGRLRIGRIVAAGAPLGESVRLASFRACVAARERSPLKGRSEQVSSPNSCVGRIPPQPRPSACCASA